LNFKFINILEFYFFKLSIYGYMATPSVMTWLEGKTTASTVTSWTALWGSRITHGI